jgi:hypothetical protein
MATLRQLETRDKRHGHVGCVHGVDEFLLVDAISKAIHPQLEILPTPQRRLSLLISWSIG